MGQEATCSSAMRALLRTLAVTARRSSLTQEDPSAPSVRIERRGFLACEAYAAIVPPAMYALTRCAA